MDTKEEREWIKNLQNSIQLNLKCGKDDDCVIVKRNVLELVLIKQLESLDFIEKQAAELNRYKGCRDDVLNNMVDELRQKDAEIERLLKRLKHIHDIDFGEPSNYSKA